MSLDIEDLKRKILYRCSYRGTKEMDILMKSFVQSLINNLDNNDLIKLNDLVNLDDEDLSKIKNSSSNIKEDEYNEIIIKFKKFKI